MLRARAGTVWHEFGESNFSATPTFGELEFEIAGGCLLNCTTKTTVRRVSGFVRRVCAASLNARRTRFSASQYLLQKTTNPLRWSGTVKGEYVRSPAAPLTLIRRPHFQKCPQKKAS